PVQAPPAATGRRHASVPRRTGGVSPGPLRRREVQGELPPRAALREYPQLQAEWPAAVGSRPRSGRGVNMAEDSTRRLLKLFGVAMTDCEDALAALDAALRDPSAPGAPAARAACGRAARELSERSMEVTRAVAAYQTRANERIEESLRGRGGA